MHQIFLRYCNKYLRDLESNIYEIGNQYFRGIILNISEVLHKIHVSEVLHKIFKYITPNISELLHQYFRSITPHLKFITPYISGIAPNISEVFQEIFPFPPSLTVLSINIPERDILRPSRQQVGAMYTLYSKSLKEHYTAIDLTSYHSWAVAHFFAAPRH